MHTTPAGQVKQVRICHKCDHTNSEGATICERCGTELVVCRGYEGLPLIVVCKACGQKNMRTNNQCVNCETSLDATKREFFTGSRYLSLSVRLSEKIPKILASAIRPRTNESALRYWHGHLSYGSVANPAAMAIASVIVGGPAQPQQPIWPGVLVLTNQRFIFVQEQGILSKTYTEKESILHEHVTDISSSEGLLTKIIRIVASSQGRAWHIQKLEAPAGGVWKSADLKEAKAVGEEIVRRRLAQIEDEKKRERIQFVIDFSFLKEEMLKGGITVQSVNCPNCKAPVVLPAMGSQTKCQYCGSILQAQDVFEKLKGLLHGL